MLFYIQVFRLMFNIIAYVRTTSIIHSIILDFVTVNIISTVCTLWSYSYSLFIFSSTSSFIAQYEVPRSRSRPYKPLGNRVIFILWLHVRHIRKISKIEISFMSVRLKQLGSHWTHFYEILYLIIFRKSVEIIKVSLNSDKNNVRAALYMYSTVHVQHCTCSTVHVQHCTCSTVMQHCTCTALYMQHCTYSTVHVQHCTCSTVHVQHCTCSTVHV